MIIRNLNLQRPTHIGWPVKANPPLQVYADDELPNPVATQRLQTIAGHGPQIVQTGGGSQNLQPLPPLPLKALKFSHRLAIGKTLGAPIAVTQDQTNTPLYVLRKS